MHPYTNAHASRHIGMHVYYFCILNTHGFRYSWIQVLKQWCQESSSFAWLCFSMHYLRPEDTALSLPRVARQLRRLQAFLHPVNNSRGKGRALPTDASRSPRAGSHWPGWLLCPPPWTSHSDWPGLGHMTMGGAGMLSVVATPGLGAEREGSRPFTVLTPYCQRTGDMDRNPLCQKIGSLRAEVFIPFFTAETPVPRSVCGIQWRANKCLLIGCTNIGQMRLEKDPGWGFSCFHLRPPQIPLPSWVRAGASILRVLGVVLSLADASIELVLRTIDLESSMRNEIVLTALGTWARQKVCFRI